jgi:hypothetical protein
LQAQFFFSLTNKDECSTKTSQSTGLPLFGANTHDIEAVKIVDDQSNDSLNAMRLKSGYMT